MIQRVRKLMKIQNAINRTVFELWVGILLFGIVCEFVVFLVSNKMAYSICLLVGIIAAIAASWHMWWSINRSFDQGVENAPKSMSIQFIFRYIFLIVVLGCMGLCFGSYVLATFLGIMGMKAAAYMQPLTKKVSTLVYGEEILPPVIEYLYDDESFAEVVVDKSAEKIE